ncbi:HNH endonuclease [Streptomyces sp. NRRL S-241]|uniref:HNH endonuclease n=1 Tax=Streptomyces sp. NRRL S-241 TaxID=1463896 RepID=UPI0004C18F49|nr:HNH endonuclease [Streptomyces sp. NRRL S-241]
MAKRMNGSEKKNRKEPLPGVARRLWAFSGNECAWGDPPCSTRLVTEEGAWVGKIAHIIGAEPGSARHEAWDGKDAEQLRDFDNLLLLCGVHHDLIDSSVTRHDYPVEYLQAVKRNHESRYRYTVDDIEAEFRDTVSGSLVRPASTMRRFFAWEDANQDPSDEQDVLELVNRFAARVAGLTRMARQVLALVVDEGTVDLELVLRRFSAHRPELLSVVRELQKAEMVYLHDEVDDEERGQLSLVSGALEGLYEMWDALRGFCRDENVDVKKILVDLDFSRLD